MWNVFQTSFGGFDPADFAAYTEEKWSSHLHTRARMGVRDKLTAIGRQIQTRFESEGAALSSEANDPRPSVFNNNKVDAQWIFFTRSEAEKKALSTIIDRKHSMADALRDAAHHKSHLVLGVKAHQGGVDVMLGLHRHAWVDAQNALRKLRDPAHAESFAALLVELADTPAGQLHLVGPTAVVPLVEGGAEVVSDQLQALEGGGGEWCLWGRNFSPTCAEVQDKDFADKVADILVALLPLYRTLSWSHGNDHIALSEEVSQKIPALSRPSVGFEVGAAVEVLSGLFKGKRGVVEALEGQEMVKVRVDTLVIQVKASALVAV